MNSRLVRALPSVTLGLAAMALVAYAFGRVTRTEWVWWLAPLTVAVEGSLLLGARLNDRAARLSPLDAHDLDTCINLTSCLVSSGMAAWGAYTGNRLVIIIGAAIAILGKSLDADIHEPHNELWSWRPQR